MDLLRFSTSTTQRHAPLLFAACSPALQPLSERFMADTFTNFYALSIFMQHSIQQQLLIMVYALKCMLQQLTECGEGYSSCNVYISLSPPFPIPV
ncbi:hypothetical protein CDAR_31951 [Caerostris darwini]|uniref:Uncharacterized protein n=1 Tax=Caerostris darwini TaxID=1538125 RepID=A0AAV4RUX1_9ARAC|nr:hypothetical protein CDAR_31951 [Caerostris darwini]